MNISQLITRIKLDLGIYSIALPLENVDESIALVIKTTTLRTYSQYFPQKVVIHKSSRELSGLHEYDNMVKITLPIPDGSEIVEVSNVYSDSRDATGLSYYGTGVPMFNPTTAFDSILSNAGLQLTNSMIPRVNWEFKHPNTLILKNLYAGGIFIDMLMLHDPSLTSIPFSMEESFYKLALLDVKAALYAVIKHYNEIESAHGRINLRIEDWQDSSNERKEILREWDDVYHLERQSIYWQ